AARLPDQPATKVRIGGGQLPRLAVAAGAAALPLVLALLDTLSTGDLPAGAAWGTPSGLGPSRKLTINGPGSRRPNKTRIEPFPWHRLSAVQQTAYIARGALAMGLQMGVNVRPFVRRSEAPARS